MGSSFSLYIFTLLSLFLYVYTSPADAEAKSAHNLLQNSSFRIVEEHRQRLYRELSLSPTLDEANNMVQDDPLVNASKIVEKRFRLFPSVSDYGTANSAGASVPEFAHHAGYFRLKRTQGARKNDANAPVVVWLSGGPGCSGSLALFYENGPFHLTKNLSLVWNDYGWDKESNLLYLDQPIGTGFSYYTNKSDIPTTSEVAAVDFYDFLQHPEYVNNDLYITGESYAGHYIPSFAARVHHAVIKQGMAIGNGMTNPGIQYKAYPTYALKMNLINHSHYNNLMTEQVST
ncbi:serine carboxypeptidase-like 48 [Phtheirospermum japonicum]|uniref:Carboxypeptidase n=1 Tax=Phtheirospermum japonicum TaxID=374723 RepID=A0A830AY43_9LAMI|nr:serine carboxypeptidase-like 48 [Phtheirospermum japonicum]